LPTEEAASLLAMHCLVRGQVPQDYTVLILPAEGLLDPVGQRADELLEVGRAAAGSQVRLSSRQKEVLDCLLRDLSNKEIGAQLHVTERTVKFHISELLAKFKVRDRISLRREAAAGWLRPSSVPANTLFGFTVPPALAAEKQESPQENTAGRLHPMTKALRSA
jgi:DNA-binding CsgD family transcriptional regulator